MLDLRRLRLLRELHERGTVAAVADALQFTPSAVSQQLAVLEREAGVPLLEKAGRGAAADRPRAGAGRARRGAARARGARGGRPRGGGRHGGGPRADRGVRVGRAAARAPGDRGARRARRRACAASSWRPSPSRRCRRSRSATSTWCWPTSGGRSRAACPRASCATSCPATRCGSCCPPATPPRERHRGGRAAGRARRRAVGDRRGRHGLGGDDAPHLPRARRLRPRRPPPDGRRDGRARARRRAAWR